MSSERARIGPGVPHARRSEARPPATGFRRHRVVRVRGRRAGQQQRLAEPVLSCTATPYSARTGRGDRDRAAPSLTRHDARARHSTPAFVAAIHLQEHRHDGRDEPQDVHLVRRGTSQIPEHRTGVKCAIETTLAPIRSGRQDQVVIAGHIGHRQRWWKRCCGRARWRSHTACVGQEVRDAMGYPARSPGRPGGEVDWPPSSSLTPANGSTSASGRPAGRAPRDVPWVRSLVTRRALGRRWRTHPAGRGQRQPRLHAPQDLA